ncbi:MAG: GPR endopeptidase [Clostridia bacterium]|nr:GPR endopeptidase [Clostridia bacterium]
MSKNSTENTFSRSDLACERIGGTTPTEDSRTLTRYEEDFPVTETVIEGDDRYPSGRYVTVTVGKIWLESDERMESCIRVLARELQAFVEEHTKGTPPSERCIMIAGLGNRFITADSLGPLTVDKLTVTKHVMGHGGIFDAMGCSRLCAVQPGVLGQTGIEAAEIIKGAAAAAKPHVIIAIDALAARSTERLASTVQISDGGIRPGSGIGNKRVAINRETVGYPVIAVGIPTVVDSSTLVWDALEQAEIEDISPELRHVLENGRSFFVSPKDSDIISDELSTLLANTVSTLAGL